MTTQSIPSFVAFLALVLTTGVSTSAWATPAEIPSQLTNQPTDDDLNGPCSLCRVKTFKAVEETSGSNATLELYFEDEAGSLQGTIELLVLTFSGDYHVVTIEDVIMDLQETEVFELEPVAGWDWSDDVKHVWAEPLPEEPSL